MAGKSGRTINNVPQSPIKSLILSWEGILVLVLVAVNIFCSIFSEFYNLDSLLRQMPIYLAEVFLMLAMAYILVLGEIDISVGAIVCLAATVSCIVCNTGAPFIVVVLSALGVGVACGAINGFILTRFPELPPMIVTLATQIIFRGIAEIILGSGGSISANNTEGFKVLSGKLNFGGEVNARGRVVGGLSIPYILFLVIILAVIFAIILGKSTFGRRVYAIGTNRITAHYSGIHVQKIRFIIYTIMGLMAGLCSLFLVSTSYGANTTTGNGFEMDAIAMAVFGGISSTGGKGNLAGGIISAFIIVCLRVGLGQKNVNAQVILLILGVLLIAAVALPNIIGTIRNTLKKKAA
ncbi:MAG: ABC transporter permease [Blautia sp.]|nr:ABC transporter permease [Butyrivibrio sp.]MBP3901547.1 ABC transporter permease [Blautia sp.]